MRSRPTTSRPWPPLRRGSVAAILTIALDVFKEIQFTRDLGDERSHVFVGDARVLGKPVKTTWLLEFDAEGKIRDIWLMARPLTGFIALTRAGGPPSAPEPAPRCASCRSHLPASPPTLSAPRRAWSVT